MRENMGLLLNVVGALATEDIEKEKLKNAFFASIFTAKIASWKFQTPKVRETV